MPAQRVRVLVAAGLQADAPDADQDLGAVGDHQRLADEIGGAAVALAAPVDVLVANRGGDLGRLAVVGCVVAAHDPLQLGKLADHVGQQVGLGKQRGAIRQRGVGADAGGDPGGDAPHAPDAIALAAELAVIDDLVERRNARLERALPVLVVEELRVGQARPDDALVAFDDARRVGRRDVADDEEAVGEPAVLLEQREVALVRLHRQDQAFRRHGEELRVEAAGEHVRQLDQRGDFVEQRVVVDRREPGRRGGGLQLAQDLGAAIGEAGDHGAFVAQLLLVAARIAQDDRRAAAFEAMAVRRPAGVEAERANRDDVFAVQRDEAVRRPDEAHARPAVFELVLHDLRDRQLREGAIERALQPFGERCAGSDGVEEERLALAVEPALQARHDGRVGAERGELLEQRRRRRAGRRQADARRHQLVRDRAIGGALRHRIDQHGETARRRVRRDVDARLEQRFRTQAGGEAVGERRCQLRQCLRRQLLDEQLDQQRPRRHGRHQAGCFASAPGRLAASCAATSSAHAFGAIGKPSRARLSR